MSANSLCTISCVRSLASACRRACRSPRRPSVIIFSAYGLTALAFASVVLIRPCSISEHARFAYSALRWAESRPSFLPVRACRMALFGARSVVAAEVETVLLQRLLDLFDRLLAEVRDRRQLVLGLHDEIADRLDADTLQAVVRADAELELLDREVLHPVRERGLGADTVGGRLCRLAEALHLLDVREDRELADEHLGCLAEPRLRLDGAGGRDVERELVLVGALPDAGGLHLVGDAAHRREDRVDRNHADRVLRATVELGGHIAPAAPDREGHLEPAAVGEVRDLELRVEDLELRGSLDVTGGDDARALGRDVHLDLRGVAVQARNEVLEVEDDVRHVLTDARKRRELVRRPLDLHRGDCGALQRGEQHAAQRVAERVTKAAVERLDDEDSAVVVRVLMDDLRRLKVDCASCQLDPFSLLRIELDDELLLNRCVDLAAFRLLQHLAGEAVVVGLQPRSDGGHEVGGVPDRLLRSRAGRHRDDVVGTNLEARNVHAAPVYVEVPVADELTRLCARRGKAEAVHDVVETRLEHAQQLFAPYARTARRVLVVDAGLLLEQPVVAARLLLLAQLQQVLALLDAAATVLARRIRAALDSALFRQAALALEEQLHPLAAADAALRA